MKQLTQIQITGFRSIKDATIELRPLNVLIGPKGVAQWKVTSSIEQDVTFDQVHPMADV